MAGGSFLKAIGAFIVGGSVKHRQREEALAKFHQLSYQRAQEERAKLNTNWELVFRVAVEGYQNYLKQCTKRREELWEEAYKTPAFQKYKTERGYATDFKARCSLERCALDLPDAIPYKIKQTLIKEGLNRGWESFLHEGYAAARAAGYWAPTKYEDYLYGMSLVKDPVPLMLNDESEWEYIRRIDRSNRAKYLTHKSY